MTNKRFELREETSKNTIGYFDNLDEAQEKQNGLDKINTEIYDKKWKEVRLPMF